MSSISSSPKNSDEFVREVSGFFDGLAKRSNLIVGLALGVVVVVAVFAVVSNRNEQVSDAGRSALYLAEKSLDSQENALAKTAAAKAPSAPVTAPGAKDAKDKTKKPAPELGVEMIMFQRMDVNTQFADAVGKLKAVAHDFGTTRAGFDAALILGKLYLNHGDAAQAAEWFSKSTEHAPSSLDRALSWNNLGYAHENEGKYKEALAAFDQALSIGEAPVKGDILINKARAATELNDTAQAQTIYEQIQKELPNTEYAKLADLYKARLK